MGITTDGIVPDTVRGSFRRARSSHAAEHVSGVAAILPDYPQAMPTGFIAALRELLGKDAPAGQFGVDDTDRSTLCDDFDAIDGPADDRQLRPLVGSWIG